jgi:ABC-type transport system involved in multi-copper enzyme maturation permease subunit
MAIFQHAYQGFHGQISSTLRQPWVIFRYALADVFSSKLFTAFFALCFIPPLVMMCMVYMNYNLEMLSLLNLPLDKLITVDANFFAHWMQIPQMWLVFALVMFVGPALISPDISSNALPLYLSRPINKTNYVFGKLLVLLVLGSLITWIPAWLLILFHANLGDQPWLLNNLHIPLASVVSSLIWIICLSMLSLAVSAWVKWKALARLFFFGFVWLSSALGAAIENIYGGWKGSAVSFIDSLDVMVSGLYGVNSSSSMPSTASYLFFITVTLLATLLLARKIRAFEVNL